MSTSTRASRRRELLYDDKPTPWSGVATGDMGIGKDGLPTANFTRGMELMRALHAAWPRVRAAR